MDLRNFGPVHPLLHRDSFIRLYRLRIFSSHSSKPICVRCSFVGINGPLLVLRVGCGDTGEDSEGVAAAWRCFFKCGSPGITRSWKYSLSAEYCIVVYSRFFSSTEPPDDKLRRRRLISSRRRCPLLVCPTDFPFFLPSRSLLLPHPISKCFEFWLEPLNSYSTSP